MNWNYDYVDYCNVNDRWISDAKCKGNHNIVINSTPQFRGSIDNRITNQLCANGYDSKFNSLCWVVNNKQALYKDLYKISPSFSHYVYSAQNAYNPTPKRPFAELFRLTDNYTTDQLFLLYNAAAADFVNSGQRWKDLFAKKMNITPFPDIDFLQTRYPEIYTHPEVKSLPSSFIVFKTNQGLFMSQSEMVFPYIAKDSYGCYDKELYRVILTARMVPDFKWEGPWFKPLAFSEIPSRITDRLRDMWDKRNITILPNSAGNYGGNMFVFTKTRDMDKWIEFLRNTTGPKKGWKRHFICLFDRRCLCA